MPQKATIADVSTEVASLVPICDAKRFVSAGALCGQCCVCVDDFYDVSNCHE